ncbi:MAG: hypothetical protein U0790_04975 [Isosphaeraceae bacterium]
MNRTTRQAWSVAPQRSYRTDRSRIQALIDEATTDSNDESDEHAGLLGMVREEVACPFRARLVGEEVECLRLEWPRNGYGLQAVCRTGRGKLRTADIAQLELVEPLPRGYPWIEAYLTWRTQFA